MGGSHCKIDQYSSDWNRDEEHRNMDTWSLYDTMFSVQVY